MEMFLKKAGIISTEVNVIFEEYEEVLQYDPEDVPNELRINEDWKLRNQVTIDQRKRQLKQRLLPTGEYVCGYRKSGRVLHECNWDQMKVYNLA